MGYATKCNCSAGGLLQSMRVQLFRWSEADAILQYLSYEVLARMMLVMMGVRSNGTTLSVDEAEKGYSGGPSLHFKLYLGEKLHKSLGEIEALPTQELILWCAYYSLQAEKEEERSLLDQLRAQRRR